MPDILRACPRCYARVLVEDMDFHIDWHSGVRDGFHKFQSPDGGNSCMAEQRNSPGGAFWYCALPADHWYHQPLPKRAVQEDTP